MAVPSPQSAWGAVTMTTKSAVRTRMRARRDAFVASLSPAERASCFRVAPAMLAAQFAAGRTIAGYFAYGGEADPARILAQARDAGAEIAISAMAGLNEAMAFRLWAPSDAVEPGPFGLGQPCAGAPAVVPDVILTPLIAFTRQGDRLGQGGGYFDRAFAEHPGVLRVGLAWSVQEAESLPRDPWDMPLDAVLTEREWIDCGPRA